MQTDLNLPHLNVCRSVMKHLLTFCRSSNSTPTIGLQGEDERYLRRNSVFRVAPQ